MFGSKSFKALAYDFETTGLNVATLGVCQSALCIVTIHQNGDYEIHDKDVQLLNPLVPIEPAAAAIHGYDNLDVADKPHWDVYLREQFKTVDELGVAAHVGFNNITFDNRIACRVGLVPAPSLDMIRVARKFKSEKRPGWESATLVNSYLQLLGKPLEKAHDAFADVQATLDLIKPEIALAGLNSVDELALWSINPDDGTPNMKINFGKHNGQKLKNLERSYVQWLLSDKCEMKLSYELRMGLEACL